MNPTEVNRIMLLIIEYNRHYSVVVIHYLVIQFMENTVVIFKRISSDGWKRVMLIGAKYQVLSYWIL